MDAKVYDKTLPMYCHSDWQFTSRFTQSGSPVDFTGCTAVMVFTQRDIPRTSVHSATGTITVADGSISFLVSKENIASLFTSTYYQGRIVVTSAGGTETAYLIINLEIS